MKLYTLPLLYWIAHFEKGHRPWALFLILIGLLSLISVSYPTN